MLPFGTGEQVAAHVRETVATLGCGGGYIFAPSQILGPDIPVENIRAMYGEAEDTHCQEPEERKKGKARP